MSRSISNENGVHITRRQDRWDSCYVRSAHPFFSKPVVVKVSPDKMMFTYPTIDYRGKTISPNLQNTSQYLMGVPHELPLGKFEFDEESTEDCLIVYFDQHGN